MKLYKVGGCVRDELLGIPSKDIDFTCVLEENTANPFSVMEQNLRDLGFTIYLRSPEYLTIRAKFPKNSNWAGLDADIVLARKESSYSDGRRPDSVEVGTLEDDLNRRDLTINAIAQDADGTLIDPWEGQVDLELGILRAVGNPQDRLAEDALRAIRVLRFSVTKQYNHPILGPSSFTIESSLREAMQSDPVLVSIMENISDERIQAELSKMFRHNTLMSLARLEQFPLLTQAMFAGKVSLDATLRTKGRK